MRNYDEIGYGSFNTYRSGDENSRRNNYGNSASNERGGSSVYGQSSRDYSSADHNSSSDPGYYGSGTSNRSQNTYGSSQSQSRYQPQNNSNRQSSGSNWTSQNNSPSSRYGSSNRYGSTGYSNRNDDRSWDERGNSWADRTGNRVENWADRAGDKMEQWGNRASNAWDRWTDDDDRNRRSTGRRGWTDQGHHADYSHGNATQNRYSDNYDSPEGYGSSSYGNSYGSSSPSSYGNRYENREGYRNRHDEDGGFFDSLGNKISHAWDRWVGNDEDEERRYQQQRSHYGSSNYGSSNRTSSNDGPPYNYGSASRRDYEW